MWSILLPLLLICMDGALTAVRLKNCKGRELGVKIWMHRGSMLGPLLILVVVQALSDGFGTGCGLCVDDLILMAEWEGQWCPKI